MSIGDVSKCAFIIVEVQKQFVLIVLVVVIFSFSIFVKLQQPSSFSQAF